ncbi:MAG: diguanylate cyclase [Pseudoxanthomonas sp.]
MLDFLGQALMDSDRGELSRTNFGRRLYPIRIIGLTVGALCVGAVLHEQNAALWLWVVLGFDCLLWPHLAYLHVVRSRDPIRAEHLNLMTDAMFGGFWIAAMGFDTLPSVLLAVMLTMDKVIVGGSRYGAKAFGLLVAACAVSTVFMGFHFDPYTSYRTMVACLPLLIVYPLAIGVTSRRLAQRTLRQKRLFEKTSRFDAATGLMNRQQWQYAANVEFNRFVRAGRPAVLILIDIDCFKQINDGYGHTVGDAVIEEFARLMKACLRDMDTGGRYGGDEFGIVMPETHWEEAIVAAERLRRQVAAYVFPDIDLKCTISIGLAEINYAIADVTGWISNADSALYEAKRKGRDCIEVATLPPRVPYSQSPQA